jgi:nucleotide-binding universal stress UspA family protein
MKPTHVLIPVDFSETSPQALDYGLSIAAAFSSRLTLVHVLVLPVEDGAERQARERLAALLPPSAQATSQILTPRVERRVEDELLRTVAEISADLVVLGTRGLGTFKRFLLGSTTEHLLRILPVPMLTVSHATPAHPSSSPRIRRILCPTDFSDTAEGGVDMAIDYSRHFGAALELVHVVECATRPVVSYSIDEGDMPEHYRALLSAAAASLERIIERKDPSGVRVTSKALLGHSWQAIMTRADEIHADLIVIALHGMSFVERALLGATAERIIRASKVPVLGVPALPDAP